MPFETAMIAGVPAVLNLAVKSAQTGFEVSQAPQETDELFRYIASIRKDILTAKQNRKQLAHACDDRYLDEWDRSIRDTESALAGLEKLVEPSRVDVQVNGRVSFMTNLMWVVRDSKSLNATNHRLTLAHNRMIMAPIRPGMRQDNQQSNPYIEPVSNDPPPSYQQATMRAVAERRKEDKERRHSSAPMGSSYQPPPSSNPVPTAPEPHSPNRQSPPPRDWPDNSRGDLPSNRRADGGRPGQYHSRSRTVSSPANVPTLQSSSPSVTTNPIPRSTYPSRSTLTLIPPNPQASREPLTQPPLDEDLVLRRTISQPEPFDYAYSPASLGEHLAQREHNALMSAPAGNRSDDYSGLPRNPPMSEIVHSPVDIYNSPISPSPTSPTRKPVATATGNWNATTGRQLRVPQKLAARPPLPETQPPQQAPDSFPSYSAWEPSYQPQPQPRQQQQQQQQQSQPGPQQQRPRPPYPSSIAPEPESDLFYSAPPAQPKSHLQPQQQAQPRPRNRPPYPPSIAPAPENSNPFSTPASTSPSQTPPLITTATKSAPNRMPTRKAVPQRRPPYPSSIVEGAEGHAYSAPAAIPKSTSTMQTQTYPQTQRQPAQPSMNPYSAAVPQHPQHPQQQNTNPYRRTRTTPTSPLLSNATSDTNKNSYTITNPTTSPKSNARWRADPSHSSQAQPQTQGDIPLPSGRWTSEREEWEDWDESDDERKKGDGSGAGAGAGSGVPYSDFPEAGYMAYRPGRS